MNIEEYFDIEGTYELIDGFYNVNGDVRLIKTVDKLPCKFGVVTGYFYCSDNKLTSLQGAPKQVGGDFHCYCNNFINLEGSPKQVGGYFDCSDIQLTSLQGAPKQVIGHFYCHYSLRSSPEYKRHLIHKKLSA